MNYMMTAPQPFLALVDDDPHSSRLMTRMLLAHGAPSIEVLEGARAAAAKLGPLLADPNAHLPGLVIVDLKQSSNATRDFIAGLVKLPRGNELVVAALSPSPDREVRQGLLDAGAAAVFQRHADVDAYRRETASIISFWVRHQRLSAIGT